MVYLIAVCILKLIKSFMVVLCLNSSGKRGRISSNLSQSLEY